jgi:serine/threonine-protein kinase
MPDIPRPRDDAATTPVGITTICPQCGVMLDAITTTCGACGAVITGAGSDTGRGEKVRAKLQDAIGDAFVLGELVGRGGMGMVYRAREAALDRDVALKVLAFDPTLNPDAYARFEREAKLAARLDHPHIVPIFSVGQRAGVAFYTMRMVKGGSVEQLLKSGRRLDVDHAISILRDVAAALDFAHANGVVHRDIKPANILIGDSGHAMVADFGIARAFGGDAAATATSTGVVGSPAYMSPEQWRGEKVDGRADQYALGVLAFELLTGKRPFATASMQELVRMHLAEEPPDILAYRDDLPSHTTDAVWRALAKDPADRFGSSTEFVDALAGAARASSSRARPTIPMDAARGVTTVKHVTPRPPQRSSQQAPPRSSRAMSAPPAQPRRTWIAVALLLVLGGTAGALAIGRMNARRNAAAAAAVVVSPAAQPASPLADSIAALQKADSEENARLQQELADARQAALTAEHKAELLSRAQAAKRAPSSAPGAAVASAPPVEPPHAHIVVIARGGTPRILVDGRPTVNSAPAVVEVAPGKHTVAVRGAPNNPFTPSEYNLDLAPNDTQQVVFVSPHAGQNNEARRKRVLEIADSLRKAKHPPE